MKDKLLFLKDIVENTPFPIAVYVSEELIIEFANSSMIQTWGKGSNVIGKKYLEILPEIQKQQIFDEAYGALKTGIPFHAKNKRVDLVKGGENKVYYFNYSFIPLRDSEGNIYGIMNTGADVTDLHDTKLQIQLSDERLRMAVEASGMGTYEIDLATKKIKTSWNFNTIWSLAKETDNEDVIAKIHPEDQLIREKTHNEALQSGKISYEARIINDDNSVKWVKVNGNIIKDENENPATIIGIVQDIHEQKQVEQELKKQVEESTSELLRSNNDLYHFASVVSHDLKEPVRKIRFFNGLLKNEIDRGLLEKSLKHIDKIDQSTKRMQNLIDGILSYSTIDKNTQPVQKINLNEIIENIKIDLELIIKEKDAILIADDLPEIEGAAVLIQQVFYNLIQNALKFSKADLPPRVIITSSSFITNYNINSVQICIKDNGIGIDPVHAEKIFDPFERLHSKHEYEGNGLGLSICRKIIKRHNGTITAKGSKENGTEFIIILPLKQSESSI